MRSVKITQSELPGLLPPGSRCDFYATLISHLRPGDVVVMPDGKFRRCLLRRGQDLWVTDQNGLRVERHALTGSLYRADIQAGKLGWLVGSCIGLLAQLRNYKNDLPRHHVEADPRLLWRAQGKAYNG